MNKVLPTTSSARLLQAFVVMGALSLVTTGCGTKVSPDAINQTEAIQRLDFRLQQLEQRIGEQPIQKGDQGEKTPAGPVKSLTLRLGTVDDRLRIYWADGTTSNLPCTEEQKTWVCG